MIHFFFSQTQNKIEKQKACSLFPCWVSRKRCFSNMEVAFRMALQNLQMLAVTLQTTKKKINYNMFQEDDNLHMEKRLFFLFKSTTYRLTGKAVIISPIAFIQAVIFSLGTRGWLQRKRKLSLRNSQLQFVLFMHLEQGVLIQRKFLTKLREGYKHMQLIRRANRQY